MSSKSNTEVIIGGKVYTLSGYEGEDYLQRVAAYINNKINEFNEMEEFRRFPVDMKATLVELNIADDYFKAKERIEHLEQEAVAKDKEIYELKHDLISEQMKTETAEKTIQELKELQEKEKKKEPKIEYFAYKKEPSAYMGEPEYKRQLEDMEISELTEAEIENSEDGKTEVVLVESSHADEDMSKENTTVKKEKSAVISRLPQDHKKSSKKNKSYHH